MNEQEFSTDQPGILLVNNDPPGVRCNRNIQAAAEVANIYRVRVCAVPRSTVGSEVAAPAVYFNGRLVTADGDAHNGVADSALLLDTLEKAGVPKQERPGRLTEIVSDVARFRESIGEPPA